MGKGDDMKMLGDVKDKTPALQVMKADRLRSATLVKKGSRKSMTTPCPPRGRPPLNQIRIKQSQ